VHETVLAAVDHARGLELPDHMQADVDHCREQAFRTLSHLREMRGHIKPD
jgi:hypothetical protein